MCRLCFTRSCAFDLAVQQHSECEHLQLSCLLTPLLPLVPNKIVHTNRMPMMHQYYLGFMKCTHTRFRKSVCPLCC
jgi:hypothetical protein